MNKPSNYSISNIGKKMLYTTTLFTILQMNSSFSHRNDIDAKDNEKWTIENTLDFKNIYKSNITKSILEAKSFPIHLTYSHEKECEAWWLTLRRTISFDKDIQALILTDNTGEKKKLFFHVKVPFDYNEDQVNKLFITSFWFNTKDNKFTMQGIYQRSSKNKVKEIIGKLTVGSVIERIINFKKTVMLDAILPGIEWEKKYNIKMPINNANKDIVDVTILVKDYIAKK